MDYANAIKQTRKKKGLTQHELAALSDISQTALSQIETGETQPKLETIAKICKGLGIEPAIMMVMALSKDDVEPHKQKAYNLIMPIMRNLAMQLLEEPFIEPTTKPTN